MRQSKHEYDEIIRSIEERGAARERERYFATIGTIAGELKKLTDRMTALMLKMEAKSEAAGPRPQPKKRKAVEASDTDIQLVREIFDAFEGPMIPSGIAKRCSIGVRRIGRACEALRKLGEIDGGDGGYRLVQRKEGGLDETTLPS